MPVSSSASFLAKPAAIGLRPLSRDQEAKLDDLYELTKRANVCKDFNGLCSPAQWLAWARKIKLQIPPDLENAVAEHSQDALPKISDKPDQATDAEIDSFIRAKDANAGRRVGKLELWKLARKNGLRVTKQKLEERAKLATRNYPQSVGRPKKPAQKTGPGSGPNI